MNDSIVKTYSSDYKEQTFLIWYQSGKPGVHRLKDMLPVADNGNVPSTTVLGHWIKEEFESRAAILDEQVKNQLEQRLVKEKIEMLSRHSTLAKQMQVLGVVALETFEKISVSAAIRLLVEGIRIERESSGIPAVLAKLVDKTDEELLDELQKIIEKSPVSIDIVDPSDEGSE